MPHQESRLRPAVPVKSVEFDPDLIQRHRKNGPRYTSYPTADRFDDSFNYRDYLHAVASIRTRGGPRPLSLYPAHPVLRHGLLLLRLQQDRHEEPREGRDLSRLPEARDHDAGRALRRHERGLSLGRADGRWGATSSARAPYGLPSRCAPGTGCRSAR